MTGLLSLSGQTSLCFSELEPAKDTVTRSRLELTVEIESRLARARHKKLQKKITFFIFFSDIKIETQHFFHLEFQTN